LGPTRTTHRRKTNGHIWPSGEATSGRILFLIVAANEETALLSLAAGNELDNLCSLVSQRMTFNLNLKSNVWLNEVDASLFEVHWRPLASFWASFVLARQTN